MGATAFTTDAVCLSAIADCLQQLGVGSLPNFINDIEPAAHVWATNQIYSILGSRGWLPDLISQWDLGVTAETELTIFRTLSRAGVLIQDLPSEVLQSLDWRKEMRSVELTINGVWQPPDGVAGQPSSGLISGMKVHGRHWGSEYRSDGERDEHVGPGSIWG